MKKLKTLMILAFAVTINVYPQWEWQNPIPQGNILFHIQFIDENTGWMMGDHGTMLKTTDAGENWNFLNFTTNQTIYSFHFVNNEIGWVCGFSGVIQKTTDGGNHWVQQDSGHTSWLFSIYFVNENNGWSVGAENQLFYTTNGGTNWQIKHFDGESLRSIFFIDENIGWITGLNKIYKTTNSGATWISYPYNLRYGISHTFFIDSLNGWGIGGLGLIAKTTDGGKTWNEQLYTDGDNFYSIKFINELEGYVVGSFGRLYTTKDGGVNWKLTQFKYDDLTFYDISLFPNKIPFIVGDLGVVFKSSDSGKTWFSLDKIGFDSFKDIQFIDDKIGWMISVFDSATVYKTIDGGITWVYQFSYNGGIEAIHFADYNNGWVVGDWGKIYITDDGGNHWKQKPLPDNSPYSDVQFFSDGLGYAISIFAPKAYRSKDFGINWELMNLPISADGNLIKLHFVDEDNGWILVNDYSSGFYKILRTKNKGESWFIEYVIQNLYLWDMFFLDNQNGWVVGDSGTVLHTTDMGENWSLIHSQIGQSFYTVYFMSPTMGYVGGYGFIKFTNDGGYSWSDEPITCHSTINKIISPDRTKLFAIGNGGTILSKQILTTQIDGSDLSRPNTFSLSQNYPNPFNPSTKISWQSPVGSWQTLKVYDVLGNLVTTLVDEYKPAGSYEVEFKSTVGSHQLANGIYFYQLKAGNFVETKKMILLK